MEHQNLKNEAVRLNKYLSDAGICSRREADRLISEGRVTVDGRVAVMGEKVTGECNIICGGKKVERKKGILLLAVNKPVGVVCSTSDNDRAMNIVDFLNYPERIFPIGRLDKDSEGLILMTDKGDIADKILRGSNMHEKEYLVTVNKPIDKQFIKTMENGVPILDTVTRKCRVVPALDKRQFKITITQGLNRQIRRMCGYCGYGVVSLKRIRILNITLGNLKTGEYRIVNNDERKKLFEIIGYEE